MLQLENATLAKAGKPHTPCQRRRGEHAASTSLPGFLIRGHGGVAQRPSNEDLHGKHLFDESLPVSVLVLPVATISGYLEVVDHHHAASPAGRDDAKLVR